METFLDRPCGGGRRIRRRRVERLLGDKYADSDPRSNSSSLPPRPVIRLCAVTPEFERYEKDEPTSDYLYVQQTLCETWMRDEYLEDGEFEVDAENRSDWVDWDDDLRGRLVRATPELLKERFTCPECDGTESVLVGTKRLRRGAFLLSRPRTSP